MNKEVILFAAAFGLCASLGWTSTGCGPASGCPTAPDRPPVQSGKPITHVTTYGDEPPMIHPQGGTFASTGATIVISYVENGVMQQVVYAIDGPPPQ